jgi:integrase
VRDDDADRFRSSVLRALVWADVDLADGLIRVERSMNSYGDSGEPKSRAGRRSVPIVAVLRDLLVEHKLVTRRDDGLVFGSSVTQPFTPTTVRKRALTACAEPVSIRLDYTSAGTRSPVCLSLPVSTQRQSRHTSVMRRFRRHSTSTGISCRETRKRQSRLSTHTSSAPTRNGDSGRSTQRRRRLRRHPPAPTRRSSHWCLRWTARAARGWSGGHRRKAPAITWP